MTVPLIRVLLVEDHTVVGEALATMLSFEDDIAVVATVPSGTDAVRMAGELRPDIVLMDIRIEGLNGVEATRRIREEYPEMRVIALTMHDDAETVAEVVAAGAHGFVPKNTAREDLLVALRKVSAGEAYLHPSITAPFLRRVAPLAEGTLEFERLTTREAEVLELLSTGMTTKQIAEKLVVGDETVKTHLSRVYRKLRVTDRVEAVAVAIRRGIVT